MIFIVLLLILAVLLFGASIVLGGIGQVLGMIVAAIAIIWISATFQLEPLTAVACLVAGLFALGGLVLLVLKLIQPWEMKRNARIAAAKRRGSSGLPGGISSIEREQIRAAAAATDRSPLRERK